MGDIPPLFKLLGKVSPGFKAGRWVENFIFICLYNCRAHYMESALILWRYHF
ncbi:hypothetical protein DPMN_177559 [Dreissena polymorpha]|uniref:Uncharacterized protein n=1 Tax=Dreissena polymorpha TaxID=45954 RepID=A0A9D4EB85_DREPO|nr:hypothetical protein DPMN_177559 [Dreissena polymorpha]